MSTTTSSQRTAVTVRIDRHHVEQLREIAHKNASTVSRTVARLVEERFDTNGGTTADRDDR